MRTVTFGGLGRLAQMISAAFLGLVLFGPGKLVIKDVKVGTGDAVKQLDRVTVDYTGTLANGKKFDSSIGRAPFSFLIGASQVIKGWDQGVLGMKVGGVRILTIPSDLAYGDGGTDGIPPKATLTFEIRLIKTERVSFTVTAKGKGRAAGVGDTVELHYTGKLADGKQFDTSYGRGPFSVTVGSGRTIPGFDQGVFGMKVGEKRTVKIPSALGYGPRGAGGVIPPNADLIFELEALKITPK